MPRNGCSRWRGARMHVECSLPDCVLDRVRPRNIERPPKRLQRPPTTRVDEQKSDVGTDPASNFDEMLAVRLSDSPTPVPGVERLSAMNAEPEAAAEAYRQRVLAPYAASRPRPHIAKIREQLSGACAIEIAAFDEFAGLLAVEQTGAR